MTQSRPTSSAVRSTHANPPAMPTRRSEERSVALPHGIELYYQTYGDPDNEALLLVMGMGGPMTWWPEELCVSLAQRGFHVIRYDNRDTGRSTKLSHRPVNRRTVVQAFLGRRSVAPYSIPELADDAWALLDHLGIERVHVAGLSMGGMIAQTMAIGAPDRVASLTSIMSTTGRRWVGWQDPRLMRHLLRRSGRNRDEYADNAVKFARMIASPDYPVGDAAARDRATATWNRGVSLDGVIRQMVAITTQRDRTEELGRLRVPTTVMHGLADRLVHVSGGRATARAIPGAELVLVPGMGHDLPPSIFGLITEAILRSASRPADPA